MFNIYSTPKQFWQQFVFIFVLTLLTQIANVAYQKFSAGDPFLPTILPSFIFLSVLTIPSILIGLKLGKPLGLGLVNQVENESNTLKDGLKFAITASIPLGLALLAVRWGLEPFISENAPEYGFRGPIGGLLVSLGAGVGEEVWFRFGLTTLLLFGVYKFSSSAKPSNRTAMAIILFVGIGFGLAHLPQLASFDADTTFSVWGTIIGNLAVSALYGWCFWRYGLISAMVAHFTVDIVLHFITAFF